MKKWGLACGGAVSRTCLSALPSLRTELGGVASTSFRLATRIANSIKAGSAVREMSELERSRMVLLCAPGAAMKRVTAALLEAKIEWKGRILLALDSGCYSSDLSEFSRGGASVASLNPVDGYRSHYVIEGDHGALREAKNFVRGLRGKPIEVNSDRVRMYDAGRTFATSLFTPLIESCVECMRQAGVPGPIATSLAEALLQRSLRSFMHAGRKSWTGHVPRADREKLDSERAALFEVKPLMGVYFRQASDFAFDLFQTFPELTRYNSARWLREESER